MHWPISLKFCTVISTRLDFVMPLQNFRGLSPKKIQGPKTCKIWPDFGRLESSTANISGTDEDFRNRKVCFVPRFFPHSAKKSAELWSKRRCNHTHPKSKLTFSEDHILAPKGCCAPKFLRALELDQVVLSHTPPPMGISLTNFFKGGSIIGLKFTKCVSLTLAVVGVSSTHRLKCNLISYNKFIKLQPFIIVFVDISATAAAFVGTTVRKV